MKLLHKAEFLFIFETVEENKIMFKLFTLTAAIGLSALFMTGCPGDATNGNMNSNRMMNSEYVECEYDEFEYDEFEYVEYE